MRDKRSGPGTRTVHDVAEARRFEIREGDHVAWLEYSRGTSTIVLVHTEVPAALAGRGIAGELVRHALELARAEGLRVEVACPFVTGWLARHPEYADLLHRGAGPPAEDPFWF